MAAGTYKHISSDENSNSDLRCGGYAPTSGTVGASHDLNELTAQHKSKSDRADGPNLAARILPTFCQHEGLNRTHLQRLSCYGSPLTAHMDATYSGETVSRKLKRTSAQLDGAESNTRTNSYLRAQSFFNLFTCILHSST